MLSIHHCITSAQCCYDMTSFDNAHNYAHRLKKLDIMHNCVLMVQLGSISFWSGACSKHGIKLCFLCSETGVVCSLHSRHTYILVCVLSFFIYKIVCKIVCKDFSFPCNSWHLLEVEAVFITLCFKELRTSKFFRERHLLFHNHNFIRFKRDCPVLYNFSNAPFCIDWKCRPLNFLVNCVWFVNKFSVYVTKISTI